MNIIKKKKKSDSDFTNYNEISDCAKDSKGDSGSIMLPKALVILNKIQVALKS
jgi:hypothetical protein